jgi:hypothetical protein
VNVSKIGKTFRGHVITVDETRVALEIFESNAEDNIV